MEIGEPAHLGQLIRQDSSVSQSVPMAPAVAPSDTLSERHSTQNAVDFVLRGSLYQVVASRRLGYDTLVWQVPALGLTAQAFLFTIALNGVNERAARLVSASLALVIALISMQLMSKHRYHEEIDSRLLEALEINWKLDTLYGCAPHAAPRKRVETIRHLSTSYPIKPVKSSWVRRQSSYQLWMYGLSLFALAAAGIIVTTLVDVSPWLKDIPAILASTGLV